MTRIERNKGSYRLRQNGLYQVKYPLGWSEADKKYANFYETVATEAEAVSLLKSIGDYIYHGGKAADIPSWRRGILAAEATSAMTVQQFAEEFISTRERQKAVEPRTIQSDMEAYARIDPYIGNMLLTEVAPKDIDTAFACMRSSGPDNLKGRAYSGTTLQKTYSFLSMLFDKAVDYEYIAKNPLAKVKRPRRDTKEKETLSSEEAQALFSAIVSAPLASKPMGLLICMCAGLRLSEMLSLQWADYRNGTLHIGKSLVREKQAMKDTKNHEKRDVPCPPPLIAALEDWKTAQQAWYADRGLKWTEKAPIVQSRKGTFTLQRSFDRWFEKARLSYPIPDNTTVHQLRHTYTTMLNRDCGTDSRTTRSMTGHKSDQAFAIYTHTNPEFQRMAANKLGKIIAPDSDASRCQNCKHWAASPHDPTTGTCWAQEDQGLIVTSATSSCQIGRFSISTESL